MPFNTNSLVTCSFRFKCGDVTWFLESDSSKEVVEDNRVLRQNNAEERNRTEPSHITTASTRTPNRAIARSGAREAGRYMASKSHSLYWIPRKSIPVNKHHLPQTKKRLSPEGHFLGNILLARCY